MKFSWSCLQFLRSLPRVLLSPWTIFSVILLITILLSLKYHPFHFHTFPEAMLWWSASLFSPKFAIWQVPIPFISSFAPFRSFAGKHVWRFQIFGWVLKFVPGDMSKTLDWRPKKSLSFLRFWPSARCQSWPHLASPLSSYFSLLGFWFPFGAVLSSQHIFPFPFSNVQNPRFHLEISWVQLLN